MIASSRDGLGVELATANIIQPPVDSAGAAPRSSGVFRTTPPVGGRTRSHVLDAVATARRRGLVGAIACHLLSSADVGEERLVEGAGRRRGQRSRNPAQVLGSWQPAEARPHAKTRP